METPEYLLLSIGPPAIIIALSIGFLILSYGLVASTRLLCASPKHDPGDDLQCSYESGNDVRSGNEFVAKGNTVDGPDGTIDCDCKDQSRYQGNGRAGLHYSNQLEKGEEEEAILVEIEGDSWSAIEGIEGDGEAGRVRYDEDGCLSVMRLIVYSPIHQIAQSTFHTIHRPKLTTSQETPTPMMAMALFTDVTSSKSFARKRASIQKPCTSVAGPLEV